MEPIASSSAIDEAEQARIVNNILSIDDDDLHGEQDICRVCRISDDGRLYHPCLCTGSIKYVHQECLLQWLKYSKKEVCELCNHKFSFKPVYREDMPETLPIFDFIKGMFKIGARFLRLFLTYCIVALCWGVLVPLLSYRIFRMVFSGLISSFLSFKILNLFSTENLIWDIGKGSGIVLVFLGTFISVVWLREQIMIGGPPNFMNLIPPQQADADNDVPQAQPLHEINTEEIVSEPRTVLDILSSETNELIGNVKQKDAQSFSDLNKTAEPGTSTNIPSTSFNIEDLNIYLPYNEKKPLLKDLLYNTIKNNERMNLENEDQQREEVINVENVVEPPPNPDVNELNPPVQPLINLDGVQGGRGGVIGEAERIVDDFTWQRLLGLDGTFAFVEHVFWTISLNVVFDVVFLYWPAKIGSLYFHLIGYSGKITYFELPITVIAGYLLVFFCSIIVHRVTKWFHLRSLYNLSAIVYLMLKVFLLIFVEVGLFPIICGWWLDICSLPLTGATLDSRIKYFEMYPFCSMFLHWLAGMIYVFYSASFILVLRELLRPGVLWFIRNLNDPEFNPVLEMIQQPLARHFRRLVASTTLFFSIILLVVYAPLRLIRWFLPMILPYQFSLSTNTPVGELSLELVLLQIILPSILEYSKAFTILKKVVRIWCRIVGGWLKLDSYLLPARRRKSRNPAPDVPEEQLNPEVLNVNHVNQVLLAQEADEEPFLENEVEEVDVALNNEEMDFDDGDSDDELIDNRRLPDAQAPARWQPRQPAQFANNNNLGARHQALLMMREPINFEDYEKPDNFPIRIAALLGCLAITSIIVSSIFFVVPVSTGRIIFYYLGIQQPIHDLYTIAVGLYLFWILARLWLISRAWLRRGWNNIRRLFQSTAWLALRLIAGAIPLAVIIPCLLGIYFQLLVVGPLRVSINQTAIFFTWKEWAMGVVHFKIFCASVLMGPDWWLKNAFEEVYNNGIRGFQLKTLYIKLIIPIINIITFQMAYPYVIAKIILQFLDLNYEEQVILTRYAYPFALFVVLIFAFVSWQWKKLKNFAEKIRNDKYLIGTQLVNFYRDNVTGKGAGGNASSSETENNQNHVKPD